jgi:TIGR03009 family protein
MRTLGLTLANLVVVCAAANAQQAQPAPGAQAPPRTQTPPAAQPAPGAQTPPRTQTPPAAQPGLDARNRLDALLMTWEQKMTAVQTILAQVTRTSVDKTFQVVEVYQGTAKYMKPNLAMLDMKKKGKEEVFEKYICTGTFLYEYAPQDKEIRVHELPSPKPGQVSEDSFLSFLFGMRAEEAKRRYDLRLVKGPPEDQWYYYVEISPRYDQDKQDFKRARLVLMASTFLPRELWFEQPNGNEVKWDIPKIESGVQLNRTDFTSPQAPPGWQVKRMPKASTAPRVVRPNQ